MDVHVSAALVKIKTNSEDRGIESAITCGMISPTIRTAVTDNRMAATGVSSRSMKIGSACGDHPSVTGRRGGTL